MPTTSLFSPYKKISHEDVDKGSLAGARRRRERGLDLANSGNKGRGGEFTAPAAGERVPNLANGGYEVSTSENVSVDGGNEESTSENVSVDGGNEQSQSHAMANGGYEEKRRMNVSVAVFWGRGSGERWKRREEEDERICRRISGEGFWRTVETKRRGG